MTIASIDSSLELEAEERSRAESSWVVAWQRFKSRRLNIVCLIILAIYLALALLAFTPFFNAKIIEVVGASYSPPSFERPALWLGTDIYGRSVFWRVLYGTRMALTIAGIATSMGTVLGLFFGVLAGYFGGWVDNLIIWLFTTLNTVPWILLVIAMTYVLKDHEFFGHKLSDLTVVILALGFSGWTGLCRLVRGEVLRIRELDYVVAAKALGIGTPRILLRHVVPQTFHLAIISGSLATIGYVQAEVVLSFLGLGISRDPSWGRMIDDAKLELLRNVWWELAAATAAIFIFSLVMNFLGDGLRDALDPKLNGVK